MEGPSGIQDPNRIDASICLVGEHAGVKCAYRRSMDSERISYAGRAFLYVLCLSGPEDILKIGISQNPFMRWSAFHPRWFEAFDLEHSLLVETETRGDAQSLETQMHRTLNAHRCPIPMTMRQQAGGETEWYRGAYSAIRRIVEDLGAQGYVVHHTATPWLVAVMREQQDTLVGLIHQAHSDAEAGWLTSMQRQALFDLLDAHRALDPGVAMAWPAELLDALGYRHG